MGYSLKIGDAFLTLDSKSSISIEVNTTLTAPDFILGDYSLPFSLPFDPVNDIALNLARIISNTQTFEQDYNADLYMDGDLFISGILNVTRIEGGRYICTFTSAVIILKNALLNLKLSDIPLGGNRYIGTTTSDVLVHAKNVSLAAPLVYDYCFPTICNSGFYGSANTDYLGYINTYDAALGAFKYNSYVSGVAVNNYCLIPMPYLGYLLKQMFALAGFTLAGDFISDPELQQLFVYSNFAIDQKNQPEHHTIALLTTDLIAASGTIIFDNDSSGFGLDTNGDYNTSTGEWIVPLTGNISVRVVLVYDFQDTTIDPSTPTNIEVDICKNGSSIATYNFASTGTTVVPIDQTFDIYLGSDIGSAITVTFHATAGGVDTNLIVHSGDSGSFVEVKFIPDATLNSYSNTINLRNHVPDILCTDFLLAIFTTFLVKLKFDNNKNVAYLNLAKNIIPSTNYVEKTSISRPDPLIEKELHTGFIFSFQFPSDDDWASANSSEQSDWVSAGSFNTLSDFPQAAPNTIAYALDTNTIYASVYDIINGYEWYSISDIFFPLPIGLGGNSINPALSPLFMDVVEIFSGINFLTPVLNAIGSSTAFNNGITLQKDVRLMFYRGMQYNSDGDEYPMASSTIYDYVGDIIAKYALQWDKSYGLFEMFHKAFVQFIMPAKLVTYTQNLTGASLKDMDVLQKQYIDRVFYFISRIRLDATPDQVLPATVELLNL